MSISVNDIINKDSELVFICESPHIDEVVSKYPLAGFSGKQMTQYLLGENYKDMPLGLIAKENVFQIKKFSLINVSQKPMQKSAYSKNGILSPKDIDLYEEIRTLRTIKECTVPTHLKILVDDIYNDFRLRCSLFLNNPTFIPCGKFAQAFFSRFRLENDVELNYIEGIPHPSRNQWSELTQAQLCRISLRIKKA